MERAPRGGHGGKKKKRGDSGAPPAASAPVPVAAAGPTRQDLLQIDGSILEGGGQILRNSMALSAILGKGIEITKIRAGRDKPGLKAQHMTGIQLVSSLCQGKLTGDAINSMHITFEPGNFIAKDHTADTKTAGSISLLIQVALPCVLLGSAPVKLTLGGGTNAEAAPQIDYLMHVFQPIATRLGINFKLDVKMRGYYPRGMGLVELSTTPVQSLQPLVLTDPGKVVRVKSRAFVAGSIPIHVADRMNKEAKRICKKFFGEEVEMNFENVQETRQTAYGDGTGIIIIAETSTGCILAGSALGERGKSAEIVGGEAANSLVENVQHGGCLDEYLQDQFIFFMALADGVSRIRTGPLTMHTQTAIHFTSLISGAKFTVTELTDKRSVMEKPFLIECTGIGFKNRYLQATPAAVAPAVAAPASLLPSALQKIAEQYPDNGS